jgi:Leucine-rich repeat (LRR) protein
MPLVGITSPTSISWATEPEANVLAIPDENLRDCVVSTLNEQIRTEKLSEIESLDCKGVSDLSGLQHAISLTNLRLEGTARGRSKDLTPLSHLPSLESLSLPEQRITDLSPLAQLRSLNKLNLRGNPLVELDPLRTTVNLTELDISETKARDLAPLTTLKFLSVLTAEEAALRDVTALADMHRLTEAHLSGNNIHSLPQITSKSRLTILNLDYNAISNVSPLAPLLRRTEISVNYQRIQLPKAAAREEIPNPIRGFWGKPLAFQSLGQADASPQLKLTSLGDEELSWSQEVTGNIPAEFSGDAEITITQGSATWLLIPLAVAAILGGLIFYSHRRLARIREEAAQ